MDQEEFKKWLANRDTKIKRGLYRGRNPIVAIVYLLEGEQITVARTNKDKTLLCNIFGKPILTIRIKQNKQNK